jgi:protein O-GlcNAc transferase
MLWLGVPIVTYPGVSSASRTAASFLHQLGLDELIADDWEDYRNIAINLAQNASALSEAKQRLAEK